MTHQSNSRSDTHPKYTVELLPRGDGELVLVVDDDPVQRRLAARSLKQIGYTVAVAASGEEALAIVKDKPHDVLLLDMVMDGIDGAETLRCVKDLYPDQRAILFSGFAPDDRVHEAMAFGAREFLSKPVRLDTLAHAMHRALKSGSPSEGGGSTPADSSV